MSETRYSLEVSLEDRTKTSIIKKLEEILKSIREGHECADGWFMEEL